MRWNFRRNKIDRSRDDEPTYKNPLYAKQSWQAFVIARFGTFGWLTVLTVILIAYVAFYSPVFGITDIRVEGASRTTAQTIADKFIVWQMGQRKWLVFRQNNLIVFSKQWLRQNLDDQYSLADVTIKKKLPHTLTVTVSEKAPALVWVTNDAYYYVDENGGISPNIDNAELAASLPNVFDETNAPVDQNTDFLPKERIQFIVALKSELADIPDLSIQSFSMTSRVNPKINAKTEAGYIITFDSALSLDTQITKLTEVLNTTAKETPPKEYIDLTLGDRVYMK